MSEPEPLSDEWFESRFRELLGPCDGGVRGKFRKVAAAALEWAADMIQDDDPTNPPNEDYAERLRAKAREIREGV